MFHIQNNSNNCDNFVIKSFFSRQTITKQYNTYWSLSRVTPVTKSVVIITWSCITVSCIVLTVMCYWIHLSQVLAYKGVLSSKGQVNVCIVLISLPVHLSSCVVVTVMCRHLPCAGSLHCDSIQANSAIKLLQYPGITDHCNCTFQLCHVQHCSTTHSNTLDSYHKW